MSLHGFKDYLFRIPTITFLTESAFPGTFVVSVLNPAGDSVDSLKAQPFVRFVLPDLPFLFCH